MAKKPRDLFLGDDEGHANRLLSVLDILSPGDPDTADEIARLMHTIKGNAAAVGFPHLAKYVHALESLMSVAREGRIPFDQKTIEFLREYSRHIVGALAIYKADPESPLTLREKLGEIVAFLKSRLSEKPSSVPSDEIQTQEALHQTDEPIRPLQQETQDGHFLAVLVGGHECYLPVALIVEVIHRPEIVPVLGSLITAVEQSADARNAKLIRFREKLMPLISPAAFFDSWSREVQLRSNMSIPWAVLLRDERAHPQFESWFCLPVDDIIEIRNFPQGLPEGALTVAPDKLHSTLKLLEAA